LILIISLVLIITLILIICWLLTTVALSCWLSSITLSWCWGVAGILIVHWLLWNCSITLWLSISWCLWWWWWRSVVGFNCDCSIVLNNLVVVKVFGEFVIFDFVKLFVESWWPILWASIVKVHVDSEAHESCSNGIIEKS